jgi:type 2 lantibiotic biosynthesis protein LanM
MAEPAWPRALSLAERAALPGRASADPDWAARRLKRWQNAHELEETGGYAEMLRTLPGGQERLLELLGQTPGAGAEPAWWELVRRVLAQEPQPIPAPGNDWRHEFAMVTAPFMRDAAGRLAAKLKGTKHIAIKPVLTTFMSGLSGGLVALVSRTLILELNVLREQGLLPGESTAERFASFIGQMTSRAGLHTLLEEYPVLARMLAQKTESTLDATWELLRRWEEDREQLAGQLNGGQELGQLESVEFGLGDGHQGGRSVAVVGFSGGRKLVYKPRPLAVHAHLNELLSWLSAKMPGLELKTLAVADFGTHGWVEFAEQAECTTLAQVRDFYHRLGAQMALLYAVDGTDFHFENLIACADQPVLVDLEALFHQPPPGAEGSAMAEDPAMEILEASVMRIGLLPMLVTSQEGAIDLSGLGGDPGSTAPFASASWDGGGTDTMRVVRKHLEFAGGRNRPAVEGAAADLASFTGTLIGGFNAAYQAIAEHREELGELAQRFARVQVRIVLRATQTYATLLNEGTHPDLLRDGLNRDRHYSYLWAASAGDPSFCQVVPYELADLWAGDVPIFATEPGSRDLWTSQGERLPGFFHRSGLERVRAKLAGLGEADRERQVWIIEAALATRPGTLTQPRDETPEAPTVSLVEAATRIGDRLTELSIERDGRISWLGLEMATETTWRVGPLRWDLYSGAPGVALFLRYLATITGDQSYLDLARRALWPLPALFQNFEGVPAESLRNMAQLRGFAGLPGLAYALTHLGEPELADRAISLIGQLTEGDESHDILNGSAGTIGAMLAVHEHTGGAEPLRIAAACGEHLLANARPAGAGLTWPSMPGASQPLTGFSHGAAGIGWALIRLGRATGAGRFTDAGLAAFAYEHELYRPQWANWPDFRGGGLASEHMFAWCHGAPGIGLARVALGPELSDGFAVDLGRAVTGTLENGFGQNHSLCHGDLGSAELLSLAGHAEAALRAGARVASATQWRCGTPNHVPTPGLMTGLAGIGLGLLRLAEPRRVPSVLLLERPK